MCQVFVESDPMALEPTLAAQADRHMPGNGAPERPQKWNSNMADTDARKQAQEVIATITADLDEDLIRRRFEKLFRTSWKESTGRARSRLSGTDIPPKELWDTY